VTRMRRKAEDAEIVVVNHHLFFADLALRGGPSGSRASAIPAYDAVIFDEAHQLEDIATDFFGSRVSLARIDALVRDATRTLSAVGLVGPETKDERIAVLLDQTTANGQELFLSLSRASRGSPSGLGRRPLRADDYDARCQASHSKLDASLEALAHHADAHVGKGEAVALVARRARDLRSELSGIVEGAFREPDPDDDVVESRRIAWLDVGPRTVSLGSSPIALGGVFRKSLWGKTPTVICTSATLATGGANAPSSFHFVRARLGAPPEAQELVVPSPFDFEKNAVLYLAKDLPEPADPAFEDASLERIVDLIGITRGGAFVLCTSNRAMRRLYDGIGKRYRGELLVQGETPKQELLARFRDHENAVLVATMSFWEGVDVPGRALRLVILDKIPFAVPSDPVVAARSAEVDRQGGNSFAEYSVPAAAITLKQGFGRLLRTQDDAGIVAILDRRLVHKGYGKRLLACLPPARRTSSLDELRDFWRRVGEKHEGSA
jgi:ATP-dependent DNA helicase DinG